jgi:hypothetical protein
MTLEYLLHRGNDPASGEIASVQAATTVLDKGFRMSEGNSCFHGGKPDVSDTVASALWDQPPTIFSSQVWPPVKMTGCQTPKILKALPTL